MSIKVLSKDTIEKITAGEVVERPVSVAKELIENSIDAGASGITVEIRGGGMDYLRVTDNGCGIEANEIKLAFQNHATSKIESAEQLSDIGTMGFRGEALPSIASVSKVEVSSKTPKADMGIKLAIEGGNIKSINPAGCPDGTTIIIRDLFYNIPVRKAFLKKPAYEQTLITEIVQKLAMGNPSISFKLIVNEKNVFRTYGDGNAVHAAQSIFGQEYASGLKELNQNEGAFSISGFIGVGDQAFLTRSRQCFFLNGRLINCRTLSQALEDACKGRVTIGRYPSCVLFVSAPRASVDVNVHPSKLEVRFRDEAAFRLAAQTLLSRAFAGDIMAEALLATQPKTEIPISISYTPNPDEKQNAYESLRQLDIYTPEVKKPDRVNESAFNFDFSLPAGDEKAIDNTQNVKEGKIAEIRFEFDDKEQKDEINFKLIGTYLDTYIIIQMNDSLVIIDQHAAHERLNYEKYTKALIQGVASQRLLVPVILEFAPREMQMLRESEYLLSEAGYETEEFGENTIKVSAVPFIYGSSDMRMLFDEMIDDLSMLKRAEKERKLESIIQASCKHAIKAGDKLTREEIAALLKRMLESDAPPTCPHGRPIMKVFTKYGIEQMFKRIQ